MVQIPRKIAKWKIDEVKELKEYLKNYRAFLIADLNAFPTDKLHELRKRLRNIAIFRVTKNSLFEIALKESDINTEKLKKYLSGTNLFIFTNENPFSLASILSKSTLKRYPLPGDKADEEVLIPAGDTGLPAGPILSVFGKLKIPTRVQEGKVYVTKDTIIAKPGDPIPAEAIPILQKLGIMPVYVKLNVKIAYDNGILIEGEKLKLDINEYKIYLTSAYLNGLHLATEIGYVTKETIFNIINKAYIHAVSLATEIGYVTKETINYIITNAVIKAYAIVNKIADKVDLGIKISSAQPQQQAAQQQEAKKEEKKEEEEKKASEEEIASGLASLFG
jgi:large subunit ribosomal protein L10